MPSNRPQVTSQGPFAVGSVLWRDAHGRRVCTVVAKATYALVPGESAPLSEPLPIQEEDGHWDDDPTKSVYLPSDLAPFKQAAEVVIVGSAFAPGERPAARVAVRFVVGSIDKSVDVWRPRRFRQDGTLEDAAPQKRFSLRYEYAAGGAGADNPVGIDIERADGRGKYLVPQILPPTFTIEKRDDFIPSVGLGPVAPSWPPRAAGLAPVHVAWLRDPAASPLPHGFFARFFQVAPPDQWLPRTLAANERLVLEGLHPEVPRLVTNLSGIEPRLILVGSNEEPRRMQGDLLVIDSDRGQATLTYRVQVPFDEGGAALRMIVMGAPMGSSIGADAIRAILEADDDLQLIEIVDDEAAQTITPPPRYTAPVRPVLRGEPDAVTTTQGTLAEVIRVAALPFAATTAPTFSPRGAPTDSALPFRGSSPAFSPPIVPVAPRSERHASAPPPAMFSPPIVPVAPRSERHASAPPPAMAPPPPPPPPSLPPPPPSPVPPPPVAIPVAPAMHTPSPAPSWRASESAPPSFAAIEAPAPIPDAVAPRPARESSSRPFAMPTREASPSTSASNAFGGVKAASDAAAGRDSARETISPFGSRDADRRAVRRLAVIDLLSFDPKIAARLRSLKRFASALAPGLRGGSLQGVDAPRAEVADKDRADVLRVLSCCPPVSAADIRNALADSLDDLADLDPPFVLAAGELRPLFDEVETLRAAVAIAKPVAGGDKKLLATLAIAEESLASPVSPRSDTALGLSRQIEQLSLSLSLPPRYVASEVERVLLEGRKYKRRTLLGAARVRADLFVGREGAVFPIYILDSVASSLPLLPAYPVTALCEVRPREDLAEAQNEALFAVALGRVLHGRNEG